ncbi:MAG: L,D-transpeptidase family protein [Gammaproteobacteria bacterium]
MQNPKATVCLLIITAAPALASVDESLRRYFETIDAGASPIVAGQTLATAGELAEFYRERANRPVWVAGGPLAGQLDALLAAIDESTGHGLPAARYHWEMLHVLSSGAAAEHLAELELLASDALLQQVRHRTRGAVDPHVLDPEWHLPPPEVDRLARLSQAVAGMPVSEALALWPESAEYWRLIERRREIAEYGVVERTTVSPGATLKRGQANPRVRELKARLYGPGDHDDVFDRELDRVVRAFQEGAGLEPDGIVGANTLEVMNETRFSWIDRLDANLERWRWLPRTLDATYIRVNIAAFRLRVVDQGSERLAMDVIAGRPQRQTPVFAETMKYMVFHPYWNVPSKLALEDKLPLLKADAAALAALGYEVRLGDGSFAPVTSVDWQGVQRRTFNYILRQRPGEFNALGRVKFMLPNPYSVNLHDTPNRELFSKSERGLSSGCIRISDPATLARWLLVHDDNSTLAEQLPELLAGSETRTVYLQRPVTTMLVYFTAFVDEAGEVAFRRDIYQRDAPLVTALRAGTDTAAVTPP